FLNEYEYTEDELRYILLHELANFKYGTNWLGLLVNILEMVFWWNPVVHLYKRYINNIIEVYVDSKVTKGMNNFKKCEYIKCVFKVFEIILENNGPRIDYITPFMGKRSDKLLLERFKIIGYVNKVNIPMCISIILLVLTYVFVSCRFVVQPGWEPSSNETFNGDFNFNAENSYIMEDNGVYYLYYNDKVLLYEIDINSFPNVPVIKK
ncbi:MAG: M56 family metallopeptidase, partial [Clostridia bacterium]|nr:M56 family metallopeptidase [Clostridia bacterium]